MRFVATGPIVLSKEKGNKSHYVIMGLMYSLFHLRRHSAKAYGHVMQRQAMM